MDTRILNSNSLIFCYALLLLFKKNEIDVLLLNFAHTNTDVFLLVFCSEWNRYSIAGLFCAI